MVIGVQRAEDRKQMTDDREKIKPENSSQN